jgi:heat shock protein HslJ
MRSALLLTLTLFLAGCASAAANRIGGSELRAIDVNGAPVIGDRPLTLRLADGQASGHGGCNGFTTSYTSSGSEEIDFGPVASTKMACEGPVMEQEARYFAILDAVETFSRYGDGSVSLIAPDGRAVRFRPQR